MKKTKAKQMMIDDGLPPSLIMDQKEREQSWKENPPKKPAPYFEKSSNMTEAEISLLFELKESKERGAASLGCSYDRLVAASYLEKRGFAQQHGFGPTSFCITKAGLDETKKHKRPVKEVVKPAEPLPAPVKAGKVTYAKGPKAPKAVKVNPNLSPICIECGVSSHNRANALDFLYSKIGKQQAIPAVMKAIYGSAKSTEGATDIVIKSLMRDLGNSKAKDKYEVKRIKDEKGVYTYGFYKK